MNKSTTFPATGHSIRKPSRTQTSASHTSYASHTSHQAATWPLPPAPHVPSLHHQNTSFHTDYVSMLLEQDTIPDLHNLLAAASTWILLAGFVVYPGTFTSLRSLSPDNAAAATVLEQVKHVPLVVVASLCCGLGAGGMVWLSVRWRRNYVWLLSRLYLPGAMNALAGLLSTLTSVYASHGGVWSVTAKVTGIVEGCCLGVCAALFVGVRYLLLARVQRRHQGDMRRMMMGDVGIMEKI
ncbi:hypothetical protein F5B20DRAFT_71837 [Whalleya microplaca]|nr:hypothetical protein F5B20DRAFT_71837 [Whalleya microplaca]